MIGCYRPIHGITTKEAINSYPINSDESEAFINTQFNEFETEQDIKACLGPSKTITNEVSLDVQQMYEENPYPRYKHADFTRPLLQNQQLSSSP